MSADFATSAPVQPPREKVLEWLREGRSVPIFREVLADLETPVSAYLKLAGGSPSFLLESVESSDRLGRFTFLGTDPYLVVSMRDGLASYVSEGTAESVGFSDPLDLIDRELARRRAVAIPELPRFQGGAVGYLGYEMAGHFEDIPAPGLDDVGLPDGVLMFVDTFVVFDHLYRTMKLVSQAVSTGDAKGDYDRAVARIDALAGRLAGQRDPAHSPFPAPAAEVAELPPVNMSREDYEASVRAAKEYIAAGDVIQVVLSQRLTQRLRAPAFTVYRFLRRVNPSPYMFFLDLGDFQVVGASPEMLVQVEGRQVRTRPIAGTRPRGRDPDEDAAMVRELLASPKERAEHVMLVDLGRNDIGRVARGGTVEVSTLMAVEKFSHVMHIVSQVEGVLAEGKSSSAALRACFPAGTLTGAPKIRAMEIIAELEPTRRGIYGGAVGYFSFSGDIDTAITIRTMAVKDGYGYIQAGGGIVADSIPAMEYQECMNKARAMLRAIELAQEGEDAPGDRQLRLLHLQPGSVPLGARPRP